MAYRNISNNQSYRLDEQLLNAFQTQKQEISKMKEQNRILSQLNEKVQRKDQQIQQLQKLVRKYKKCYDQYDVLKANLAYKNKQYDKQSQQNKILFAEMTKIVEENKEMQQKIISAQKNKHQFIKQRNSADNRLRAIEDTFREYQDQCKNKERQLLQDLQKAYKQIKQLNSKVEDIHTIKFQNEELKNKIKSVSNYKLQMLERGIDGQDINNFQSRQIDNSQNFNIHNTSSFGNQLNEQSRLNSNQRSNFNYSKSRNKSPINDKSISQIEQPQKQLKSQIQKLKRDLVNKQIQLQRSKALNHELSIQFDKSVRKICEFQRELSAYRKQNHELKKTLSLFVEREEYQKMHKNNIQRSGLGSQQESEEEDEGEYEGGGTFSYDSSRRR